MQYESPTPAKNTSQLLNELKQLHPEQITQFYIDNPSVCYATGTPFKDFMVSHIKQHGYSVKKVLETANIPTRYGYRIINEEKHTKSRDYILRICFAASFSFKEIQKSLRIYGMGALDPRKPRDGALISLVNNSSYTLSSIVDF